MEERSIDILINGANGRMGTRIRELASSNSKFRRILCFTRDAHAANELETPELIDVVIDFSSPDALANSIRAAQVTDAALLVGTTGLGNGHHEALQRAASDRAVLVAPNTSPGVAIVKELARIASKTLGIDVQIDLIEAHHNQKKDAPSGTALDLIEAIHESRPDSVTNDRVHCIRAGGIIGRHTLTFTSPCEEIQITHNALSRDLFAAGALRAARWLIMQPPGLYSMDDVCGLHPDIEATSPR